MSDLIDRQAAIDAIRKEYADTEGGEDKNAVWKNVGLTNALHIMQDLPTAQPETHDKRTKTHACDSISRQAAIDAIEEMQMPIMRSTFPEEQFVFRGMSEALSAIKELPSAEPEMIREIRKWINSNNRGNADYFIVEKIEEIINKYE